jgi:hypothetical protein
VSDNDFPPVDATEEHDQQPTDLGHLTTPPADATPAAPAVDLVQLQALMDRVKALEAEKEARDRADAVAAGEQIVQPPTHILVLANGDTVETVNPSVTHHSDENGVYPVISRHVINPE